MLTFFLGSKTLDMLNVLPRFEELNNMTNQDLVSLLNAYNVPPFANIGHVPAVLIILHVENLYDNDRILEVLKRVSPVESIQDVSKYLMSRPITYRVYDRSQGYHLLTMTPRFEKITYTPLGATHFARQIYVMVTYLLAKDPKKYLVVPSEKLLTTEEFSMLKIITEPITGHKIIDLPAMESVYQGTYGKTTEKFTNQLKDLFPRQDHHIVRLRWIPKTDQHESKIFEGMGLDVGNDESIMFGSRDKKSYLEHKPSGRSIHSDLIKNTTAYYYVTINTEDPHNTKNEMIMGHALAIVISLELKTLEVVDSGGATPGVNPLYYWVNRLIEFLKDEGIELKRIITVDEPFCPQTVSSTARQFKGDGQCSIWAYWYLWLRARNPTIPATAIRQYMASMPPDESYRKMQEIGSILYD